MPRLTDRSDLPGATLGAGLLLLLAAFGASLVHIVEYHLGLGSSGDWRTNALSMLAHCPLSGSVVTILLCTLGVLVVLLGEVRALSLQRYRLSKAASRAGARTSPAYTVLPRRPARLFQLLIPLLALQLALYELADHLWAMGISMRMDGVLMTMPLHGAAPLLPLHVMIALVSALLIWRLERRLTVLRAVIACIRRLLGLFGDDRRSSRIPPGPALRPLSAWVAPAVLSRPPPA